MTDRTVRFRIGVFVLTTLILLAVLIMLFGSFPSLFKRHTSYVVSFQDAPGIAPGTPVRRSGVRIGEVGSLDLDEEASEVRVRILIESRYHLYHSDVPTIVTGLLGGDTSIDFVPKTQGEAAERRVVQPGEVLVGARLANINTLLTQATAVVPTTQETLSEMQKTLKRFERLEPLMEESLKQYTQLGQALNRTMPDVQKTNQQLLDTAREIEVTARNWGRLGENVNNLVVTQQDKLIKTLDNLNDSIVRIANLVNEENQRNVSAIIKNVRTSSDNLDDLMKHTDELVRESQKTIKTIGESVSKADEALQNLNKATRPFAERGETISRSLDETTDRLNRTLGDVQALMRAIGQEDGTFKRLISDPSLYNNIDMAACQVTRLLSRAERIVKDMEVFADKLARHPELIGAGGIVRPSSGLKEAPSGLSQVPHLPGH